MVKQNIVAIGGSAGAIEALTTILANLSPRFPGSIFVVLHTSPQSTGALPQILQRSTSVPVAFGEHDVPFQPGHIYVAPPDHHLTVEDGKMSVVRGPPENGFRPAVDPLFRSIAKAYKARAVGVVLSGAMDDGTFGLIAIKESGGTAIVQHPYEAFVPSMPLSAIQNVEVDHIVRAVDVSTVLLKAAEGRLSPHIANPQALTRPTEETETPTAALLDPSERDITLDAVPPDQFAEPPSKYVCPECGGTLWEVEESGLSRYRCYTGHGYTLDTLLAAQNGKLEHALWSAVRVLMERAALHRQLAHRTALRGMSASAEKYDERAHQEEKHASVIRDMLSSAPLLAEPLPPDSEQTT